MAKSAMTSRYSMASGTGAGMGFAMAKMLDPASWNASDFYVLISILGSGGGHAICAFIGRKDVAFFDPNFGEFYFETRQGFRNFMRSFWDASGYANSFNSFYFLDNGKRVH